MPNTEIATGRVCARCKRWRPAGLFSPNPKLRCGLNSWCRECSNQSAEAWRKRNPGYERMDVERKRTHVDPIAYSRGICEHVEQFISRRVAEFEERNGMEAPPHLRALLDVAQSLRSQHPAERAPRGFRSVCRDCKRRFYAHHAQQVRCESCQKAYRLHVSRVRDRRRYWEKKGRTRPEGRTCAQCGLHLEGHLNKRYCSKSCKDKTYKLNHSVRPSR